MLRFLELHQTALANAPLVGQVFYVIKLFSVLVLIIYSLAKMVV